MIKRLYNYELYPELPEGAKEYQYIFVGGLTIWAFNAIYYFNGSASHSIGPGAGCWYFLSQDGSAWEYAGSYAGFCGQGFKYSGVNGQNSDQWTNRDIPLESGTGVAFRTTDRGTVEYGFWDGGEDDAPGDTAFTVPQGYHVAGAWKCIVSGTDSPVAKMEWYRNNVLVSTRTGTSDSDYRPSADTLGTFTYECVITFENGKSVTAGPMTMTVEAYDPGEDPGGDPDPGGGGGGDDETPMVTGISLDAYPNPVVPGGHTTIEVTVDGIGNYSHDFTVIFTKPTSANTYLVKSGSMCNLWIGEDETIGGLFVTVTSVQDPTIKATKKISIDLDGTEEEGTTQEQLQIAFWKGYAAARAYFREAKVSGSVNIAREEAEPTTKAGKLRRSFWKGFVSALIAGAGGDVPDGVLISSDGYILTDCDGVYLIAMEKDADAVPEGALIASDGYILKDSKGRYLITRRMLDG